MANPVNMNGKRPTANVSKGSSKKLKSNFQGVITVEVGISVTEVIVHQDLICERSPFFKAACSNAWRRKEDKKIELRDHQPDNFKTYLQWAYSPTKDLYGLLREVWFADTNHVDLDAQRYSVCEKLFELWIVADYLGDATCKNLVIDNLIREHKAEPFENLHSPQLYRMIYENTDRRSGLRRWFIDSLAPIAVPHNFRHCTPNYHTNDMLIDLVISFTSRSGQPNFELLPQSGEAAFYYE